MAKSFVKIGSSIMMAMTVFSLVISLLWVTITELMFVSDFAAYTGQNLSDALAAGSQAAELWLITKKLWGVELCAISLLMLFITAKFYSQGEKWSWYALLVSGFIFWGSLVGYKVIIGYFELPASSMTFVSGATLFILGLVLPVKAIFGQKFT